ncbi:MAG: phospholipid/cholesterol/gamma-HCH transport system substrate-binding protein [Actinomycetota bacterium]|nr:phospholipid/cholesterol/gamma-HCH transport system substrate-binding protein [Actinomycetota bacterium]
MSIFNRKSGRTSFLERNQLIIGIIFALIVLGGSAGALLLSSGFFKDTYTLTASFTDAAGLKATDDVRVAGIKSGKVDSVEIVNGHVDVTMKINSNVQLPVDSRAEISVETRLGKKTVTLYYGDSKDVDEEGDNIPLDRTRTPVELVDLADTSVNLLEKSDAKAFQTFMDEVTKITDGKKNEITSLITGLTRVSSAIDDRREQLGSLIDGLKTIGATFADRDDTLLSLIDNYQVILANLEQRTADLTELLNATDTASHETASLVSRNRETLNAMLDSLHTTLGVVDKHQLDLAATISYLNTSVKGYQSVGYSQNTPNRWANIFVQSLGPGGIDAFFGPCGALDQAFDQLLGPDPRPCADRDNGDGGGGGGGGLPVPLPSVTPPGPGQDGSGLTDDVQNLIPGAGDVGDLLDSVTGLSGLGAQLDGGGTL